MVLDHTKPLWLPEGSVRALLVLGALFIAGLLLLLGKTPPDWFVALITLVVRDYFAGRAPVSGGGN